MKRGIITMTNGGRITMPQQEVWMTCDEIADMFGMQHATVFRPSALYIKNVSCMRTRQYSCHPIQAERAGRLKSIILS